MNRYLELNCELNNLLYKLKELLPQRDKQQPEIDLIMSKYQTLLRELYTASSKAE